MYALLFRVDIALTGEQLKRKILLLLDSVSFRQQYPGPLQLEYFDQQIIEQVAG